jgi:hypothetical protein
MQEDSAIDTGMEMHDLFESPEFQSRGTLHHSSAREVRVLRRMAKVLAERPADALQELVEIAVEECHADSSGVSLEELQAENGPRFRWVVVAGSFSKYLNGTTPRGYSPCGTCLDRGVAQHYRLRNPYYDFLGVTADPILDGILIPWQSGAIAGTLWIVSHRSRNEFDGSDYEILKTLADLVATAIETHRALTIERSLDVQKGGELRSNELAHAINNPLQSISNTIYLAEHNPEHSAEYLRTAAEELTRLSTLVATVLGDKHNNHAT